MQIHKPLIGTDINEACDDICEIANDLLCQVKMSFNQVDVVAEPGSDPAVLADQYRAECQRRHEAYLASDECKADEEKAVAAQRKRESDLAAALADADARNIMVPTWDNPDGWQKTVDANKDGYGAAVVRYAETWARLMEARVLAGQTIAECHSETSHLADVDGITGFQYGAAKSILSQVWIHGAALRAC